MPKRAKSRSGPAGDAGYSGKPLAAKLGLAAGQRALLLGVPSSVAGVFSDIEFATCRTHDHVDGAPKRMQEPVDYVHVFVTDAAVLKKALPVLRRTLTPKGMIWVSWPKRTAKVATDLTDEVVRTTALACGLVDVKVCAVDAVWSGLKLVIPVKDR